MDKKNGGNFFIFLNEIYFKSKVIKIIKNKMYLDWTLNLHKNYFYILIYFNY
jgi:hypothetical protein